MLKFNYQMRILSCTNTLIDLNKDFFFLNLNEPIFLHTSVNKQLNLFENKSYLIVGFIYSCI